MVKDIPKRTVLLPQALDDRLQELVGLKQETAGVLLYVPQSATGRLELRVDGLFMLGRGTGHTVTLELQRYHIVENFLLLNPEYHHIEWHTHPLASTQESSADLDAYGRRITENKEFIGMIVAPNNYRLIAFGRGQGSTALRIVPTPSDFQEKETFLSNQLHLAAAELGYEGIQPLRATRLVS